MDKGVLCLVVCLLAVLASSTNLYAQLTVQHQPPTVLDRTQENVLEFFVPGITDNDVLEATLFYRSQDDPGYSQMEIFFQNGEFRVVLSSEMLAGNTFAYYFQLRLRNLDQDVFFPERLPSQNPIELEVVDGPPEPERERAEGIDFTILSPRPGVGLAVNDMYIAISLYYDKNTVEPGEFQLLIDGRDVTAQADTSAYFISYVPKNLGQGEHTITLDYVTERGSLAVTSWDFRVVDPKRASFQGFQPKLIPTGRVELTARNQVISGDLNNALTGRTYLNGSYGLFKYSVNAYFTSQEDPRLQPQNRYGIDMSLGKWWRFQAGHVYPNLSKFTISGRRIYGISTSAHLLWDGLHMQFVYGEINRKVANIYSSIAVDTVYAGGVPQDTTYTLGFNSGGRGTFKRKIIGGRFALGSPRAFQFGLQALKVEDDTSSIYNVTNFSDLIQGPSSLYNNLTSDDINRLYNQPSLLSVDGGSPKPRGNLVAGADLRFSLDENKVRFQTETVASVLNNNIYKGPLDSLRAADLGFEGVNPGDLAILNDLSRLIIINENVTVLPIKFSFDADSASDPEPFFPTSVLGSNTELSFNYPKNNFRVQYRWIGPEFVSLANTTIRKDIAGFTFTDRFSLMSNQLYITAGAEFLNDNVTNAKSATTKTNTYRTNISWYPIRQDLPRITAGFRYRTRDNKVTRFNPVVPAGFETVAVQNLRISGSDTLTTTTPRLNNTLNLNFSITQEIRISDIVNDVTLGYSSLETKDQAFYYGAVSNKSVTFNVVSRFQSLPLRTQFGINYNTTQSGFELLNIDIVGGYLAGTYYMLEGKLSVSSRLAFTSNTSTSRTLEVQNSTDSDFYNDYYVLSENSTTSKFGTYVFIAGSEYKITDRHSLVFDSNFTNVSGANSLNDRTVQLRYIYRF